MANQGQNANYRPGVSRAITKKWAEAKAINYDDWDDSDGYDPEEPVQTVQGHGRQQSWDTRSQGGYSNPPGQHYPSNRSVIGPVGTGRASFDRGDDRRHLANVGGDQGPYPTAQRDPFEDIQHDHDPNLDAQSRANRAPPSLQLQTGGRPSMEQHQYQQGPYPQGPYTAGPGGNYFQEPRGAPFSAPLIGPSGRRSQSSGRPPPGDIYPRGESPMRPVSQNSHGGSPSRAFPPRKSSLSQQQPPPEIQNHGIIGLAPTGQASTPSSEGKALPFIRPADIYRRMEEEKEKERRSQESSRPSFESATSRIRETSVASHRTGMEPINDPRTNETVEEPDTTRRLQPTLPPVAERKSEYGFDNMMQNTNQDQPTATLNRTDTDISKASAASSDYTNRPDPTSASTLNSRQSPFDILAESPNESSVPAPPVAPFLLPAVRGVSDFGTDIFGQRNESLPQSHPQSSNMTTVTRGESIVAAPIPGSDLQHQTSPSYRSMVNQAFDRSQDQVPPTPVSMSDSVARSNSASASDISPIVSRIYDPPVSQPPIPEESNSRPGTSGTQRSVSKSMDKELPAPPAIVPGYRRDSSPALSNNPENRPLSIATADIPKGEHAIPSAATSSTASWDKDSEKGPIEGDVPLMTDAPAPAAAGASTHLEKPSESSRTTSEDWREWENSRKQFKTQHGGQDSMPSTPGVPSPISRTESPSKGTVRDIANKLESNPGTNSPVNLEPARPSNARLESFRPSLPGGWQSYTTTTGTATPQHENQLSETQPSAATGNVEEDYPKAGPPKDHSAYTGTSKTAFEALAASGSALAGAFGLSQVAREQNQQSDSSADDSRASTSMSNYEREVGETPLSQDRQLESIPEVDYRSPTSPLAPTPLLKDTPSEADAGRSTLDYFPAPLTVRQSRGAEQHTPQRPVLPTSLSTETSPQDDDNDRLRKEIVKSLTPKSSRFEDSSRLSSGQNNFPVTSGSQRTVSSMGDSNLPREYDSYWNESNEEASRKGASETATPKVPSVPETSEAPASKVSSVSETKAVVSNAESEMPPKTTLEQRFSWETAGEQTPPATDTPSRGVPLQGQGSPDTIKTTTFAPTSAPAPAAALTPTITEPISSSEALRPAPSAKVVENKGLPQTVETRALPTSTPVYTPTSPSSTFKERPVKDVLALNSPHERIQAFNIHRQHYANYDDGRLAQWLQTIGNSHPEHAAVLSANGVPIIRDDGIEMPRASPARLATKFRMPSSNYTGSGETSGTKQMQEDGKRLLHAGGKLGKKGSLAAKGLLAKAKDKARAVSSSDKVDH